MAASSDTSGSSESMNRSSASEQVPQDTAEAPKGAFSGIMTRIVSGLIYILLFIGSILLGEVPTAVFIALVSGLCCFEFFHMVRLDGKIPNELLGVGAAVLFPLAALGESLLLSALIFLLILAVGLWYVYTPRARLADISATVTGPLYTGFMLSAIVLLRGAMPGLPGAVLTIGVCASLWVSDSFAYLAGNAFGKHKMAPRISPHKTWEGFAGGIVGAVVVWIILYATDMFSMSLPFAILCGVVVSILGVFGDLIESRLKRGVGVKDSGKLIPGHGGVLDRCDSLIFGCITAELLLYVGGVL